MALHDIIDRLEQLPRLKYYVNDAETLAELDEEIQAIHDALVEYAERD